MVKRARSTDMENGAPEPKRRQSDDESATLQASGDTVEGEAVPPRSPDEDLQAPNGTMGLEPGQDMSTKGDPKDEWAFIGEAKLQKYLEKQKRPFYCYDLEDDDDDDEEEEGIWDLPDMAHSVLGDLELIPGLVDFERAIPESSRLPPDFKSSSSEIQAFEKRFGPGSYDSLDECAAGISPTPEAWMRGHAALEDLVGNGMGKEPKFADSAWSRFLFPCSSYNIESIQSRSRTTPRLSVGLDNQAPVLARRREGYLLTSTEVFECVSARKVADSTYSLDLSALSLESRFHANEGRISTRYPCLHAGADRLPPFISVEIKINNGAQKQTLQQAFYGVWNVYQQLVLRTLAARSSATATSTTTTGLPPITSATTTGPTAVSTTLTDTTIASTMAAGVPIANSATMAGTTAPSSMMAAPTATSATMAGTTAASSMRAGAPTATTAGTAQGVTVSMTTERIKHYTLGVLDDILEIWEYTPTPHPLGPSKLLRIRAKLLCKGSMHDESWFAQVYCPWRRYIAKESIVNHVVSLLPDIEHYIARPRPWPFEQGHRIILAPREFIPHSMDTVNSISLSNRTTASFWNAWVQIHSWRFRNGYVPPATRKKNRLSSQASSQDESTQQSSSLASGSGPAVAGGLEQMLGPTPVIVQDISDPDMISSITIEMTTKD
ncbi:MAG: hypothetical protein M1823_002911 [Watsoniomyces obsoletus]|nr:MAG: hypothetical protein M1823_002911 [Watsoniomyces obsoletus]